MTEGRRVRKCNEEKKTGVNTKAEDVQRALVLQGGGALAAYEAGVYAALYFWIKNNLGTKENKNIFDVIAGTSGGAINGSIIVSSVLTRRKQRASVTGSWK